jgi:hypothetical protein
VGVGVGVGELLGRAKAGIATQIESITMIFML